MYNEQELAFLVGLSGEARRKALNRIYWRRYNAKNSEKRKIWLKANPEKVKAVNREYYKRNKEKRTAKAREKYGAAPEKNRARVQDWRERNPDKVLLATKAYRPRIPKNNERDEVWKERSRLRNKRYYEANKEKTLTRMRLRRYRKAGVGGSHTFEDIRDIAISQRGKCAICRVILTKAKPHVDHIIPIVLGGSNNRKNLQLLCEFCNKSKGSKHPIDFAQSRGLLL